MDYHSYHIILTSSVSYTTSKSSCIISCLLLLLFVQLLLCINIRKKSYVIPHGHFFPFPAAIEALIWGSEDKHFYKHICLSTWTGPSNYDIPYYYCQDFTSIYHAWNVYLSLQRRFFSKLQNMLRLLGPYKALCLSGVVVVDKKILFEIQQLFLVTNWN